MKISINNTFSKERLSYFANLKLPQDGNYFIAEGEKIITSLLQSNIEIVSFLLTEEHFETIREQIEAKEQPCEVSITIAPKNEIEEIVGFNLHQGFMAAARIPKEPTIEQIIARSEKPILFVVLDEIADAENMGAIYRTSLAMGVAAMIIDRKSISPWIRRAVRVSMGAIFDLPTITVDSLTETIGLLKSKEIDVYATTIGEEALPLWAVDLSKDVALIFGSEGFGIKKNIISAATSEITFPMPEGVNSLNVAIAEGIFLYETARQRKTVAEYV